MGFAKIFVSVLFTSVSFGCGGGDFVSIGKVQHAFVPSVPVRSLAMENPAGGIAIEAAAGREVEIVAEVLARQEPGIEAPVRPPLVFADHVAVVEGEDGKLRIDSAHLGGADRNDWQLQLVVRVPGDVAVEVRQAAGPIRVDLPRLRAVDLTASAGRVTVACESIENGLGIVCTAGQVDVRVAERAPSSARIEVEAGEVVFVIPPAPGAAFDLRTTAGSIAGAALHDLEVEQRTASAVAVRTGQEASYRIRLQAGSIRLR